MSTTRTALSVDVFTSAPEAFSVTSTLVSGASDAVLIDSQFTLDEASRLARWVRDSGKRLTTIYVTHAHPDHYFGLSALAAEFPEARVLATQANVRRIEESAPGKIAQWKPAFGDAIPDSPVIPEPLDGDTIELEGEPLRVIAVGQADTDGATAVFVESLGALIAADLTFNGTHVWLAETTPEQWQEWIRNLDRLEELRPRVVVSGHKAASASDDPGVIARTRDYIRDFAAFAQESSSPEELIEKVGARYPDLELEIVLQLSAGAVFSG